MLSFNVRGQFVQDRTYLKGVVKQLAQTWILVMDDLGLAKELLNDNPNLNVIWREYPDDDFNKFPSVADWINQKLKKLADAGNPNVWVYVMNEAGFHFDWQSQLMISMEYRSWPFNIVVGNWPVGNPTGDIPLFWSSQESQRFLGLASQFRKHVVVGVHEYNQGIITTGMYGGAPDHAGVNIGESGGLNLIPMDNWPKDVNGITMFHVGRYRFMVDACKNFAPPRVVITEAGFDALGNMEAWFKANGGWKNLKDLWASWGHTDSELFYWQQWDYACRVIYSYKGVVEGVLLFQYGAKSGGTDWSSYDVEEAHKLHELMIHGSDTSVPVIPPVEPPVNPPVEAPYDDSEDVADIEADLADVKAQLQDIKTKKNKTQRKATV